MTSVGIVVMVLLLISEFMSFVRLEERDHLTVKTGSRTFEMSGGCVAL